MITIRRFADLRPDRWRNGGGITREIARDGDGPADFTWRLSLADIKRPGTFSSFPDTERIFTVVEGKAVVLDVEGQKHLVERAQPFHFPGDVAVCAALPAGPVRALNVIVRRGNMHAKVAIKELTGQHTHQVLVNSYAVVLAGRVEVRSGGVATELCTFDAVSGTHWEASEISGHGFLAVVSLKHHG